MTIRTSFCLATLLCLSLVSSSQNNYQEISLLRLMMKKQQGDNNMVIVDVRTKGEYDDTVSRGKQSNIGRLKGAMHVELRELEENPEAIKKLEAYKDKDIYLICSHSYRSRNASNLLLSKGFTHVTNVQGGMTEWFRRYQELAPYRNAFYESSISYKNISAAQLFDDLTTGKKPLLIGISSVPKYFYDSATIRLHEYFPLIKDAVHFDYADSLKVLEAVMKRKGRPVVLFNMVNNGAAELAEWLTGKGIPQVSYLVGGQYYFYEYIRNNNLADRARPFVSQASTIRFITSSDYCTIKDKKDIQLIDLRKDTVFNTITRGIKHPFKTAEGAQNFFAEKGEEAFAQAFPDKSKHYVLMSGNGIMGLEMADALTKKGYKISWLIGGLQRLEWYTINVESFRCKDILVY